MRTYFFTCVASDRKVIFSNDQTAMIQVIIDSAKHIATRKGFQLHALSIMPNHLHWLYTLEDNIINFEQRLLKYTSKKLIELNRDSKSNSSPIFRIDKSDRNHQVWRKNSKLILIKSARQYYSVLHYIKNNHKNPFWARNAFHQEFIGIKFTQRLWPSARKA